MTIVSHNTFSVEYYRTILKDAIKAGYQFVTLSQFVKLDCPSQGYFVIRHDLDKLPASLLPIINVEAEYEIVSTTFVRLFGCSYNAFSYPCFNALKRVVGFGSEIGLHTNFFEFATINRVDPYDVLSAEVKYLRSFFDVRGVAPHRDINYMYNSLPWLEDHWNQFRVDFDLDYHAYEKRISDATLYVNEGLNPHLCWRNLTPHDAIKTGKSIYMLTHPHWWYERHAFEAEL